MRIKERKYSIDEASDIFNGRLPPDLRETHRLSEKMRVLLAKAASKLPGSVVDYARRVILQPSACQRLLATHPLLPKDNPELLEPLKDEQ